MSTRIDTGPAARETESSVAYPTATPEAEPHARNPFVWSMLGIGLGLGLLYAAIRKVRWSSLINTLESVTLVWPAGILGIVFAFVIIKAWRWELLLRFVPGVSFRELHAAVYIGLAANFLVAHMGEILRTAILSRRCHAPFSGVFASVMVERALDFIALLVLLAVFGVIAHDVHPVVKLAAMLTAVVVAAAVSGLHLVLRPPAWLLRIAEALGKPLPEQVRDWIKTQLARARPGLESIRDLRRMGVAMLLSVLQWALIVAAVWWSALAVGPSASLTAVAVTFVLIVLGLTLPNAPLQIGATQFAFVVGLGVDGTDVTSSVAASIVYTAFLILPVMLIGAGCLVRIGGWKATMPGQAAS